MSRIPLIVLGVVVVLAGIGLVLAKQARDAEAVGPAPVVDAITRPFTLTSHTGQPFTDAELRGKVALLYFGYTFCPDICPTELGFVSKVMRALGPEAARVTPVFITVDPERDTVAKLKDYVPLFDPRIIGLTGPPAEIAALTKAYGVFAERAQVVTKQPGYYLMDHSSSVFVLDPAGRLADIFDSSSSVTVAVARVRRLLP